MTQKIDFESQNFVIFDNFYSTVHKTKNFLRGWLLALGIKEGLVECATVCVKSEVILLDTYLPLKYVFTKYFLDLPVFAA